MFTTLKYAVESIEKKLPRLSVNYSTHGLSIKCRSQNNNKE